MLEPIATAAAFLLEPTYWFAFFAALGLAAIAGVIPGISSFLLMALAIPFIVFTIEEPGIGLVMLATITGVDNTLDSIPAVLLGQPGPGTQVTFLEGHQLARQGYAARTLGAVYAVSAMGGLIGALVLTLAIPVIRPFILKFGFPEIAAMGMVGVAMISVLSRGAMAKGIAMALFGMLIATIGTDPITGVSRLTIGPLFRLPLVPFALGLFALPEMIDLTISRRAVASSGADVSMSEVLTGVRYGLSRWRMVIRQSLFGVFLGAIPGVGSAVIDWLSYAFGIFFTQDKTQFGKGSLDGVLFAESAQNAKEGGQAIPTLAMGVPGGPTWVLVLVGMLAYGIAPGPEMLGSNAHITILLVITLALGNLAITALGILVTPQLAKLTTIPYPVIGAVIIPILMLSAFIDRTSWRGIQVVLIIGVLGLLMKRYGWPRPPLLLGFILGPIIELNLQSGISIFGFVGAVTRPLTMTIISVAAIMAVLFFLSVRRVERETAAQEIMAGGADDDPAAPEVPARRSAGLRWRWEHLFPIVLIVVTTVFLIDSLDYRPRAAPWPRGLGIGVIVLSLFQLVRQATGHRQAGNIMDLGMLSTELEGSRQAAYRVAGLFGLFLLLGTTVHLRTGAIAFAVLAPLILLRGPGRWPLAAVTGGLVFVFAFAVLDNVLFVIWPEPFIAVWLRENWF